MISEDSFLCGSNHRPGEASLVCIQEECQGYAFTCGRKDCDCKAPHHDHNMAYVDAVLKKATLPLSLP